MRSTLNQFKTDFLSNNDNQKMLILNSELNLKEIWTLNTEQDDIYQIINALFISVQQTSIIKLTTESEALTKIFYYLPFLDFVVFFHYIDKNYPSLSFHYVMESLYNINPYHQYFISRLCMLSSLNLLDTCFSPMRARLISALLKRHLEKI